MKNAKELLTHGGELGLFNRAIIACVHQNRFTGKFERIHSVYDKGTSGYPEGSFSTIGMDSVFDIASITKTFVSLAWHAIQSEEGFRFKGERVDNHTLVAPILGMQGDFVDQLTVGHLHSFFCQFKQGHPTQDVIREGFRHLSHELLMGGLTGSPGQAFKYGNPHSIVLGLLIEKLTGMNLLSCLNKYLLRPLQMNRTVMAPQCHMYSQVVQSQRDVPLGTINDPTARSTYENEGILAGCAGLFSTAGDMLSLIEMLLNHGKHNGQEILPENLVASLHRGEFKRFGNGVPLWDVFREKLESYAVMDEAGFFKLGHTGCILVVLPRYRLGYVVLTDFLNVERDQAELASARSELYKLFASASNLLFLETI